MFPGYQPFKYKLHSQIRLLFRQIRDLKVMVRNGKQTHQRAGGMILTMPSDKVLFIQIRFFPHVHHWKRKHSSHHSINTKPLLPLTGPFGRSWAGTWLRPRPWTGALWMRPRSTEWPRRTASRPWGWWRWTTTATASFFLAGWGARFWSWLAEKQTIKTHTDTAH